MRTQQILGATLLLSALFTGHAAAQDPPPPPPGQMGPGRGGPGLMQEMKVVEKFDANKSGRLETDERKAAREWVLANGGGRRGFGPRGGGPGGPPPGGMPPGGMPPGGMPPGGPGFGPGRGMATGSPGRALKPADVRSYTSEGLYDPTALRTIFLTFENADWEQELAAFNNTDVEVPATAIVDGKTYKDVGVHFRGASSFMMVPDGLKRSLNLSFDFVHDQNLGGYRTLNLLNAASDPTFVRAVLYSEIARSYLPAPRVNYMRVVINGESWGVYLNAQQYNRDFLRDYFKTEKGARWKVPGSPGGRAGMEYLGEDVSAYKRLYEIKSKDDPKAWADLIAMFKVLNETAPEQLEAALAPRLDVDGVLKFLAIEMALVNTDGYWTRASDYSIYQDEKGRFHVIPHDMNEAMMNEGGPGRGMRPGGPPQGMPGGPPPQGMPGGPPPGMGRGPGGRGPGGPGGGGPTLDPLVGLNDASKPLRSKLLAVPALRERYLGYVRDIAERWLDWNKLGPLAAKYQSVIAEDVKADTRKLYTTEAFNLEALKAFVTARRDYLLNQRQTPR